MAEIYANNVRGKLAEPVHAADTRLTLQPGHHFIDPGRHWYRATLFRWEFTSEGMREFDHEVVKVKALTGDVLTVERGLEGAAQAYDPDTPIELRMTAGTASDIEARAGQAATSAVEGHEGKADPHKQYIKQSVGDVRYASHYESGFTLKSASAIGYSSASPSGRFAHLRGGSEDAGVTFVQAMAAAALLGVRLPTVEEIEAEIVKGSGNGFDATQCWTCTPVPGQPGYVYTVRGDGAASTRKVTPTDDTATADCRFVANVDVPDIDAAKLGGVDASKYVTELFGRTLELTRTAIPLSFSPDGLQVAFAEAATGYGLRFRTRVNHTSGIATTFTLSNAAEGGISWTGAASGNGSGITHVNAAKLGGLSESFEDDANTIVRRNGSGDVRARLFRTTYTGLNSNIGVIYTSQNNSGNDYMRPSTPAQVKAAMGLSNVANVDQRNANNLTSGTVPAARINRTASRSDNATDKFLVARSMANHCKSGDHDGRYYTKSQVDSAISNSVDGYHAVGSYSLLIALGNNKITRDTVVSGSGLGRAGPTTNFDTVNPPGSWRLMSNTLPPSGDRAPRVGLFLRIA